MARAKFIDDDEFAMMLERAVGHTKEVAEAALKAGADIIADQMKQNLEGILSPNATGQLAAAFGITPVQQGKYDGNFNVHLGFDGYQDGVPFQLIARSFESGAVMGGRYTGLRTQSGKREKWKKALGPEDYWRTPKPFAAPAVRAAKQQASEAMKAAANKEWEKINEWR